MHFPWKKAKVTRISRIVADLQSPKRGGSLVVETGFPTSIIDLFVKNRDRLIKPSIKNKKKKIKKNDTNNHTINNNNTVNDVGNPQRVDSLVDLRLADSDPIPEVEIESVFFETVENPNCSEDLNSGPVEMKEPTRVREPPNVLMAAVRVFAVAVLALSTKKLAVGVTLSAFALLFVEFVARGFYFRWRKDRESESESESEEEEFIAPPIEAYLEARNIKDDEVFLGRELEELSRDKKWGFLGESEQAPVLDLDTKKSKSKRARIRRKIIKNFVPKKLRSVSKKAKKSKEEACEESDEVVEDDEVIEEVIELSVVSEEEQPEEEKRKEQVRERTWVFVIMFGVALLGLFWGKLFALLLTVVWCIVMKLTASFGRLRKSSLAISS